MNFSQKLLTIFLILSSGLLIAMEKLNQKEVLIYCGKDQKAVRLSHSIAQLSPVLNSAIHEQLSKQEKEIELYLDTIDSVSLNKVKAFLIATKNKWDLVQHHNVGKKFLA